MGERITLDRPPSPSQSLPAPQSLPLPPHQSLRLVTKERPGRMGERITKAYVDFTDVAAATAAMDLLQVRQECVCRGGRQQQQQWT